MCLSSGFTVSTLYRMLTSVIIYNSVFTNAKVAFVALKGKYVNPNFLLGDVSLETCLSSTEYPNFIACYVMFSPSHRSCSLYVASLCNDFAMGSLENRVIDDTTVYMRVTYTSSSTVDPTSQSHSVSPSVSNFMSSFVTTATSNAASSTATISASTGITFPPQSTLTHISTSDLTPTSTNGVTMVSNPTSNHIAPTPTGRVSKSIFTSGPVTMIMTSIETFDSTQLIMTELISDLPEVTPSISMMPSSGTIPASDFLSSVHDTASEKTSGEIYAGSSLFTVQTSSESPDKNLCPCECPQSPLTGQELENSIASLRNELSVNKSTLSRTIRSKTSAPDDRPSATGIGMTGVVILVACLVFLVVSDFQLLCQHVMIMKRNLMS